MSDPELDEVYKIIDENIFDNTKGLITVAMVRKALIAVAHYSIKDPDKRAIILRKYDGVHGHHWASKYNDLLKLTFKLAGERI